MKLPNLKVIPINKLKVDYTYQREMHLKAVKKIVKDFDINLLGVLTVSPRGDGDYAVIDGSHRLEVATLVGLTELPCIVLPTMTIRGESTAFEGLNEKIPVNAFEKFRSSLAAGKPDVVDISNIAKRNGFRILNDNKTPKTIQAVSSMLQIYKNNGPDVLDKTLYLLNGAWDGDRNSVTNIFIKGTSIFVSRHSKDDVFSIGYAQTKFSKLNPKSLLIEADEQKKTYGADKSYSLANILVKNYNKSLSASKKLNWRPDET